MGVALRVLSNKSRRSLRTGRLLLPLTSGLGGLGGTRETTEQFIGQSKPLLVLGSDVFGGMDLSLLREERRREEKGGEEGEKGGEEKRVRREGKRVRRREEKGGEEKRVRRREEKRVRRREEKGGEEKG